MASCTSTVVDQALATGKSVHSTPRLRRVSENCSMKASSLMNDLGELMRNEHVWGKDTEQYGKGRDIPEHINQTRTSPKSPPALQHKWNRM